MWALSTRKLCNSPEQGETGNIRMLSVAEAAWHLAGVKLWNEGA